VNLRVACQAKGELDAVVVGDGQQRWIGGQLDGMRNLRGELEDEGRELSEGIARSRGQLLEALP